MKREMNNWGNRAGASTPRYVAQRRGASPDGLFPLRGKPGRGRPGSVGVRSARAFTMLEILLTVAIFAIGFAFVASIFPSAILLQKKASDDVLSQEVARSAETMLRGRRLAHAHLTDPDYGMIGTAYPASQQSTGYDTDQYVHPLPPAMLVYYDFNTSPYNTVLYPASSLARWTIADRGYPSAYNSSTTAPPQPKLIWVPLIQDADGRPGTSSGDWRLYVFVLQPRDNADYPAKVAGLDANPDDPSVYPPVPPVRSTGATVSSTDATRLNFTLSTFNSDVNGDGQPDIIRSGDLILDNNGNTHKVLLAEPSFIHVGAPVSQSPNPVSQLWYAHPGTRGKSSPTMRILTLSNDPRKPLVQ